MAMVKRIFKTLAIVLLVTVVAVAIVAVYLIRAPFPKTDGEIAVAGLQAPVTVYRDQWGIPHIFADSEHDLYFAQGFVHAQDRLWQMDFQRRVGLGRLSEVLGEATLDTDRFLRTLGTHRAAEKDMQLLGPQAMAALEAYADGVNAYLLEIGGRLPLEFRLLGYRPEPWQPLHSVVWGKVMAWGLETNNDTELLRAQLIDALGEARAAELLPAGSGQGPFVVPPEVGGYDGLRLLDLSRARQVAQLVKMDGPSIGSNNWVVGGSRTASGLPLLANDMHLGMQMPSVWYEIGLHGGDVNVVGFSFAGAPGVAVGHNGRIAWGDTSTNADVQDFYVERSNPDNPDQVEFRGRWEDVQVVEEAIAVKGREEPVQERVRITRHGPIMNAVLGDEYAQADPLALRWATLDGDRLVESLLETMKARNLDEFRRALSLWQVAGQNFVYADVEGNIAYQFGGRIPVRAQGDGSLPLPGWTGEYEWTGYVPFDEYPSQVNPGSGYTVSANNRIVGDDYPYLISTDFAVPYRAQRIGELIEGRPRLSADDFAAIQGDLLPLTSDIFTPVLLADVSLDAEDPEPLHRALALMRDWDGRMAVDSAAALISEQFYLALLVETLADELIVIGQQELADAYVEGWSDTHRPVMAWLIEEPGNAWWDDQRTAAVVETRADIVNRAFENAVTVLVYRYDNNKPEQWRWGDVHYANFDHPLGAMAPLDRVFNKSIAAAGSNFTVNTGSVSYPLLDMNHGVSQRMIVDLSDLSNSRFINSTGQSGLPFHRNYGDMIESWQGLEYHPLPLERAAVEALAVDELVLLPQNGF